MLMNEFILVSFYGMIFLLMFEYGVRKLKVSTTLKEIRFVLIGYAT
jgi:hypothetical protein